MKKCLSTILLVLVFLVGLSVLLYPAVSNLWNSRVQSRTIANYDRIMKELEKRDYSDEFAAADAYNAALSELAFPIVEYDDIQGYEDILNLADNGMMGYLTIPKIDVELPVYHGVSEAVLNVAVGHMQGSSLPVGGLGTHAVLSGHRGLPRAKLFSDLDKLAVGDVFTIKVLNRLLTYEVNQILVVEPNEMEALRIESGKDYCTLVTCTPYGINTHRLLVRGVRTENFPESESPELSGDRATRKKPTEVAGDEILRISVIVASALFVLLLTFLIKYRKRESEGEK